MTHFYKVLKILNKYLPFFLVFSLYIYMYICMSLGLAVLGSLVSLSMNLDSRHSVFHSDPQYPHLNKEKNMHFHHLSGL